MKNLFKIDGFSKFFLLAASALYILDRAFSGALHNSFYLASDRVVNFGEIWRLVSYPFAAGSPEGVFIFAIAFLFFSPQLEENLNRALYPIMLFLLAIMQGVIHTLLFWKSPTALVGMEGISIFVVGLSLLLNYKGRIGLAGYPRVSLVALSALALGVWTTLKITSFSPGDSHAALSASFSVIFGVCASSFTFLQLRFFRKLIRRRAERALSAIVAPKPQELPATLVSQGKISRYRQTIVDDAEEEYFTLTDDDSENEDKLNEILDKIGESGEASLTPHEIKFLKEYSNKS
ncbi:MAG: DUF6576 domain-containing protein [Chloroflexota bacterium]